MKWWCVLPVLLFGGWSVANEPQAGEGNEVAGEEVVPVEPYEVLPDAFLQAYFGAKPKSYLVDPQKLLNTAVANERLAFLKYHADDSSIDLYLCLVGGNQRLPDGMAEGWVERVFNDGKPAAVVFFPMGEAARAGLFLSPALAGRLSEAERRQALASAVTQAVAKSDPYGQLEAFLVQMSIRVYWMERSLGLVDADSEGPRVEKPEVVEVMEVGWKEKLAPYLEVAEAWRWKVFAVVAGMMVLVIAVWWSRIRSRYRFPDFSVEPRLGGAHGAGVGGVISFASAAVPPGRQRDGVGV